MLEDRFSWPSVVSVLSQGRYEVYNLGISGDTTTDALHRLPEVIVLRPELSIVELGINDFFSGFLYEAAGINLDVIIRRLMSEGSDIILAGFDLPGASSWMSMYKRLANTYKISLVQDIFSGLKNESGGFDRRFFLSDGIHPNEKGYQIIANNLFNVIKTRLKS